MERIQESRLIRLESLLGGERLLVAEFSGTEHLSELYHFHLRLMSGQSIVAFDEIVGQPVRLVVSHETGDERYLGGYCSSFRYEGYDAAQELYFYELEMVPWLWFLTRTRDCRIFQDKSVMDIIEEIFGEFGFSKYESQVNEDPPARTYVVQYNETAYDFIARLLEEEGIYYYFDHREDGEVLIFGDSAATHPAAPGAETLPYRTSDIALEGDAVDRWREEAAVHSGKMAFTDYDFEKPTTDLGVNESTLSPTSGIGDLEQFSYPGRYSETGDGQRMIKRRMEAEERVWKVGSGGSNCPFLRCGFSFELAEHEVDSFNGKYIVVGISHRGRNNWEFGRVTGAGYENTFSCIPDDVTYRPPLKTPRPRIEGPQTAFVVGPSGEEIYTDKHGRVKVRFHWDRRSQGDEKSSCWVRCAQSWAGGNYGTAFLPRVGMEVVVQFLDANPDRPMVTGTVHNGENVPPFDMPGDKTRSGIKTYSSPGGGGTNILRFEDKKGSEQIFVHAEKDLDVRVKSVRREQVDSNDHTTVGGNRYQRVGGDDNLTVGGDLMTDVGGSAHLKAGMDVHHEAGMNYAVGAGLEAAIRAGLSLTLEAAGNFINIGPMGIFIKGTMVYINSGGSAGSLKAQPEKPDKPTGADTGKPGEMPKGGPAPSLPDMSGERQMLPQAETLQQAAKNGTPFCEICNAQ